jgi:hypothetical protein
MAERNYTFDIWGDATYEDQLPEDMTDADYDAWFALSWVDVVRLGPVAKPIPDQPGREL